MDNEVWQRDKTNKSHDAVESHDHPSLWNIKEVAARLEKEEFEEYSESIQVVALFRSARMLNRVLEI